jgi:hypothetical protein
MIDAETNSKYAKFVLNEIKPRADKLNKSITEFIPATAAFYIFLLEQQGKTFRKQTREALDFLMDPTNKNPNDVTMKIVDSIFLMSKAEMVYYGPKQR